MMLQSTGEKMQNDTNALKMLIRRFDKNDGDGKIDVDEFLGLAKERPELQQGIARMFSSLTLEHTT